MALFDINATHSAEVQTLVALRDLIGDCTNWGTLCEKPVGTQARDKVVLGPGAKPWDEVEFTKDELANLLCDGHIFTPPEPEKTLVLDTGVGTPARERGTFIVEIYRYVRDSEWDEDGYGSDVYLWFLDTVTKLESEILARSAPASSDARECPILQAMQRIEDPRFGNLRTEVGSGHFLTCAHAIVWGQTDEE